MMEIQSIGKLWRALPRSRRAWQFGHFQEVFRVDKSLLSTKAERALGLWLEAPARTRPAGTYDSSPAIYRRVRDHMDLRPGGTPEYRCAINPKDIPK
jgi:hypothetical protein